MAARRTRGTPPTKHSGLLGAQAWCAECVWKSDTRNSMGIAAVHARITGHTVMAESTVGVTYNKKTKEGE